MLRRSLSGLAALAVGVAMSAGCTAVRPVRTAPPPPPAPPPADGFSHAELDRVLSRHVDERGLVDYAALARDPSDVELYYEKLSLYSPDNRPDLFPTRQDRLAYWLNAYNGAMIATVVRAYPIASVTDIPTPFPISLVSDKVGIFLLRRIDLGGETTSFYGLENDVVRRRFGDPRIHFALNCASRGCPRLPRHAFEPRQLDEQLEAEAVRFFAEPRNLTIDHGARVVRLSAILDWYESDFTGWLRRTRPDRPATLVEYARIYAPEARVAELDHARGYAVEFAEYDWRLNDQAQAAGADA